VNRVTPGAPAASSISAHVGSGGGGTASAGGSNSDGGGCAAPADPRCCESGAVRAARETDKLEPPRTRAPEPARTNGRGEAAAAAGLPYDAAVAAAAVRTFCPTTRGAEPAVANGGMGARGE
jgi:hypothetical protein